MAEPSADHRLLSAAELAGVRWSNPGLGEYRPERDREFLDVLVWRGMVIDRLLDHTEAQAERLAELEAAPRWSSDLPTAEGWYWHGNGDAPTTLRYVVHVERQTTDGPLGIYGPYRSQFGWPFYPLVEGGKWAGPIREPSEAT